MPDDEDIRKGREQVEEMLDQLEAIRDHMATLIPDEQCKELRKDIHQFFKSHCDAESCLNYAEMAYALCHGMMFILPDIMKAASFVDEDDKLSDEISGNETIH